MKALRRGCHCAILSRQDCVTWREEMRFCAIAFATDVNDIKAGSVLIWWTFISYSQRLAREGMSRAPDRTAACRQPAQNLRTQVQWNWRYAWQHPRSRARPRR